MKKELPRMESRKLETALQFLITVLLALISFVGTSMAVNVGRLTNSVEQLNVQIAVIIEKVQGHEQRISNLEKSGPGHSR